MRFWGIDPGRKGAAVQLADDGLSVVAWWEWSRAKVPPALPLVAGDVLALEAPYHDPRRPAAGVSLAEWCGRLLGALPEGVVVARPNASHWRAKVLRVAGLARVPAKARAIRAAELHGRGLPAVIGPDLAEAWCLARWSWGWDRAGRP